jgi:hypothetical protein
VSEAFDPYYQWLGIPPDRQPPDYYTLLGIARFESDAVVIQNAADQRMAHLRTFQVGRYSELSQRLLSEVARARLCLLSAEKKQEYDQQFAAPVAIAAAPAVVPAVRRAKRITPAVVGLAVLGLMLVGAALGVLLSLGLGDGGQPPAAREAADIRPAGDAALHAKLPPKPPPARTPSEPPKPPAPGPSPAAVFPSGPIRPEATVFRGHTRDVLSVAVSRDGRRMLSGGKDRMIQLWDVEKQSVLFRLRGHQDEVRCVCFSADERRALSASNDRTVRLWNLDNGEQIGQCDGHGGKVAWAAFVDDDRRAVSAGDDRTLRLWDLADKRQLQQWDGHSGGVFWGAVVPKRRRVVTASFDKSLRLWDLDQPSAVHTMTAPNMTFVAGVAVSPDGRYAVSGSYDRTLRQWDLETGQLVKRMSGHTTRVWCVAFSPDGRRVISGAANWEEATPRWRSVKDYVRLWDVERGAELAQFEFADHDDWIRTLAFADGGQTVFCGCADGLIRRWRLPGGK